MKLPSRARELAEDQPEVPTWRRAAWPAVIASVWGARYAARSLRHQREGRHGYEAPETVPVSSPAFQTAAAALTGHSVTTGNRTDILINGDRIFPAILEAIRGAEDSINLETYVYWQGDIADEVAEAICERARAGVDCRLLLDAVGSARMRPALLKELREAGAETVRFRPPAPRFMGRMANRSHRRVLVVDGRVGFTGGVGIAAEWTGDAEDPESWRETHVRIEGPAVTGLQGAFAEHWIEATGEALVGDLAFPRPESMSDGVPMQVVRSAAGVGDSNVEVLYFLAIASAEHSIDLTAAYFVPRPPFVEALCDAARRGVRVRILVPGPHADKQLVRAAGRNVYAPMFDSGVELFEYQPTMLHAKSMVVDGSWTSVGTVNFDNRSFQLNDELTLSIFDDALAGELTEAFEHDLGRSEQIEPDRWRKRGAVQQAWEKVTTPIRREL